MWPFRNRNRPHPRFVNACRGTGMMPIQQWLDNNPDDTVRLTFCCPVCKIPTPLRKHRDMTHNWPKGSLVMHQRPRDERRWWERWLNLPERNEDDNGK